jgi:transposase-like protein
MSQHFLLSAAARTLSLAKIMRMSDEEAHATFKRIRWAANSGEPFCPQCGCTTVYTLSETPPRWKCSACRSKFSVTSGTIFASRKLPIRDYLAAVALFVCAVKGISALQLCRDLDINPKSAFVLCHKLREAIGSERAELQLSGTVEVDGAYFGGHIKPENKKEDRTDRRLAENQTGKRQVVVVARERGGKTLTFIVPKESDAVSRIRARVKSGSIVHADEAPGWDALHASYDTKRINHSVAYSLDGACTNQAESYFSRLRRAEMGQHHRISAHYLHRYAAEMAWREDNRREANGTLWNAATGLALQHPKSKEWAGYWQRGRAA